MPNTKLTTQLDTAYDNYAKKIPNAENELAEALYAYACPLLRTIQEDQHPKEDVLQEAVLHVWSKLGSYKPQGFRFSTWVYRVIKNVELDVAERDCKDPERFHGNTDDILNVPSHALSPETAYRVKESIERLPEKERILVQQILRGDTVEEAATELGISRRTAFTHWKKAQRLLREDLKEVAHE